MKNLIKLIPLIAMLATTAPVTGANAAEALMPIKARIIRCVSYEERWQMCQQENLCCHLLDTAMADEDPADIQQQEKTAFDTSGGANINIRKIAHDGSVSLAIE